MLSRVIPIGVLEFSQFPGTVTITTMTTIQSLVFSSGELEYILGTPGNKEFNIHYLRKQRLS